LIYSAADDVDGFEQIGTRRFVSLNRSELSHDLLLSGNYDKPSALGRKADHEALADYQ